jgi:hypothetical protein
MATSIKTVKVLDTSAKPTQKPNVKEMKKSSDKAVKKEKK